MLEQQITRSLRSGTAQNYAERTGTDITGPANGSGAELNGDIFGSRESGAATPSFSVQPRLRSPIAWFGGKGILARKIVPYFPPHHCYVEPFCGGASCLFAKAPSPVEVINDLDRDIVNFFRVLRDPGKFDQFRRMAALTPYSRHEYLQHRAKWRTLWRGRQATRSNSSHDAIGVLTEGNREPTDVARAYSWYVIARMSFAGEFGRSWGHSVSTSRSGMANAVAQWLSIVELLPAIAARTMRVQVEHGDWLRVIQNYDAPDTFFYVDPPFVRSTRRSGKYQYELDDSDHYKLVDTLLTIKGRAILSGYCTAIYRPLEVAGWSRVDLPTVCKSAGRIRATRLHDDGSLRKSRDTHVRTETLWISPLASTSVIRQVSARFVQGTLNFDSMIEY